MKLPSPNPPSIHSSGIELNRSARRTQPPSSYVKNRSAILPRHARHPCYPPILPPFIHQASHSIDPHAAHKPLPHMSRSAPQSFPATLVTHAIPESSRHSFIRHRTQSIHTPHTIPFLICQDPLRNPSPPRSSPMLPPNPPSIHSSGIALNRSARRRRPVFLGPPFETQ